MSDCGLLRSLHCTVSVTGLCCERYWDCRVQSKVVGSLTSPTMVNATTGGGLFLIFADLSNFTTGDGYDRLHTMLVP